MDATTITTPAPTAALADFYPLCKVPGRLPTRPNGRRAHPKVICRWALQGSHGVRLRYLSAGRQKLTCDAWLVEFCAAVAAAQQAAAGGDNRAPQGHGSRRTPATAKPSDRRAKTNRSLAAAGFRR